MLILSVLANIVCIASRWQSVKVTFTDVNCQTVIVELKLTKISLLVTV